MQIRPLLIAALLSMFSAPAFSQATKPVNEEYGDFNYNKNTGAGNWVQTIKVTSPKYRADVKGDVTIEFTAESMKSYKAFCWQQPNAANPSEWGHDAVLAMNVPIGEDGKGLFVFHADEFPNGPTNIRIFASDGDFHDICELQLYNTGGVKWNQGIPKSDPPAAKGMTLAFSDDFDGPLSISPDGKGARYNAHKPKYGDFSGWQFSDPLGDGRPFSQIGTYLKISASNPTGQKGKGISGLIAPVDMDGKGFWAKPPCYLECRFTAQSAPGTWPAFWTITGIDRPVKDAPDGGGDELDIVEAYGGVGKKNPNHPGYSITSHFWNQKNPDGSKRKGVSKRVDMMDLGGKSYWSTTFHTYGLLIDTKDTVYYFDDIEVLRHPTNSKSLQPHVFLINYAIGGISGWQIDLARYGNATDMYVDYVRVYERK